MSEFKLKPCPFCGGEAHFGRVVYSDKMVKENGWDQSQFGFVSCAMCGGSNRGLIGFRTDEEAAEHWNKRHVDWHPVSEPPEKEGRYMVTTVEEVGFSFYNNGWSRFFIIAWMPLPDPFQPKGE